MIVVKIELHPASGGMVREIGRAIIANDGTAETASRGNYGIRVGRRPPRTGDDAAPSLGGSYIDAHRNLRVRQKPAREGEVLNWPRQSYSVWRLVARALLAAFPEEAKRGG